MPHSSQRITTAVVLSTMSLYLLLAGCTTLEDVRAVRDLPGLSGIPRASDLTFDSGIRAYRNKKGTAVRDSLGKKVQTENELVRITNTETIPQFGRATWVTTSLLTAIYIPIIIPVSIVEWAVTLPWQLLFSRYQASYQHTAEQGYREGRHHFDAGTLEAALIAWERARTAVPALRVSSDIDYWRGRAFESRGELDAAQESYLTFLAYSESVIPPWFTDKALADQAWENRARDTDERLYALRQKLLQAS